MWKEPIATPSDLRAAEALHKERTWEDEVAQKAKQESDWRAEAIKKLAPRDYAIAQKEPITTIEPSEKLRVAFTTEKNPSQAIEHREYPKTIYEGAIQELRAAILAGDKEQIKKSREEVKQHFLLNRTLQ